MDKESISLVGFYGLDPFSPLLLESADYGTLLPAATCSPPPRPRRPFFAPLLSAIQFSKTSLASLEACEKACCIARQKDLAVS